MTTQIERFLDFSGGIQNGSTWQLRKPNEVEDAVNARFGDIIGAITRRYGYAKAGNLIEASKTGLGLHEGKWLEGAQILCATNNADDTETVIKSYDPDTGDWTELTTPDPIAPNTKVNFSDSLNETYASGISDTGVRMDVLNISADETTGDIIVSKTKNLLNCPKAMGIIEYGGTLYAINCQIGDKVYADRAYKSSAALGIVTFTQGEQADVAAPADLIDNVPTMTSNSAPLGVASASSEYDASHQAYMAFNDDTITAAWLTAASTTTGQLQYDFGSGNSKTITYYSIVGVPLGDPVVARAPKTWTFEGSNDGSSWTTLDTRTSVAAWTSQEKRTYSVSNTTAYQYYRLNVSLNQGDATFLSVAEMELLTSSEATKDLQLQVDSVRYIKSGMIFDIYKPGKNIKLFTVTVNDVDKLNDTFTFTPYTLSFATTDVDTATDTITLSSTATLPTGTTVKFSSPSAVPGGLTADTVYYVINTSSTTIQLATSEVNSRLGIEIDLTSQGTGSQTVSLSYTVEDNAELWLENRYDKLTYFWNYDYPTEPKADFLRIPPSVDADSDIVGYAKTNNRLFLFTETSTHKWDKANLATVYEDIGCASHRSIVNVSDWLIWLDIEGKVQARNDATGQDEMISRPIQNLLQDLPEANLLDSAAGRVNSIYKLCLGTVDGKVLRVIYDFDTNTWSRDIHDKPMTAHMRSSIGGKKQLYFLSDTGYMYLDDTGDLDDEDTIPFIVKFGRRMSATEQGKNYHGVYVYSENMASASVKYALEDKKDFVSAGEIKQGVEKIVMSGVKNQAVGRDITIQISHNSRGDRPAITSIMPYFNQIEDKF